MTLQNENFTSQLCAAGVTYLRFGTRDQSVRSKDLIASVPDGRGNTTGPIGPRVSESLEGSTAVHGGSCLFVSHRSVESSEIENYYSPRSEIFLHF